MPKYKIQKTDILHSGKLYPEGSEIELSDENAKKLANYLIPIGKEKAASEQKPENDSPSETTQSVKQTSGTSKTTAKEKGTETKSEETE